jgi:hypothetical protein
MSSSPSGPPPPGFAAASPLVGIPKNKRKRSRKKSARTGGTRPTLSMKTVSVLALLACLASRCNAFHALCGGLNAANVPSALPSFPVMRKARVRAGGARLSMSADDFDMGAFFAEVALPQQTCYYATGRQFLPDDRLSQVDKRQAPSVAPGESMTVHTCVYTGRGKLVCMWSAHAHTLLRTQGDD